MKSIFVVVKAVHQHSGSSTWLEQRELDEFDTYEEAEDYIDSLTDEGDYQIAKVFRQSLEDAIKRQKEKIDRKMEHADKVAERYAALRQAAKGRGARMKRAYIRSKTTDKKYYLADLAEELGFDDAFCNQFNHVVEGTPIPDMSDFAIMMLLKKPELQEELKSQPFHLEEPE